MKPLRPLQLAAPLPVAAGARLPALAALVVAAACSSARPAGPGDDPRDLTCGDLDPAFLADGGVGRDGIPALTNPPFTTPDDETTSYLADRSRIIGVHADGEWLAVPHNVMYRHEVVNLDRGDERVVITYCPLTGSALAFDRTSVGGAEFGVSGLLYQANLIMYDRAADDSLWPQMAGQAACGPRRGQPLARHPVLETTWRGWQDLFPGGKVVSVGPFDAQIYAVNPYGASYESPSNGDYLGFPIPRTDARRPPKERVLGFPAAGGEAPRAFPFQAMEALGGVWAGALDFDGGPAAVLWDGQRAAAVAVRPVADGRTLTLGVEDGWIVDAETGSRWSVRGQAVSGPLTGQELPLIAEAYVAFWQAWAAFHPGTELVVE